MNILHRPLKTLVTGTSGSGKTTYLLRRILGASGYEKVLCFDVEGEISQRLNVPAIVDVGLLTDAVVDQARQLIVFDPCDAFPGDNRGAFDFFCNWAFEVARAMPGLKLLCSDELQSLADSTQSVSFELRQVMQRGRRAGLDVCFASQQYNIVHNQVRSQLTEVVTFQQVDRLALDAIAERGFNPDDVFRLPPLHYLIANSGQFGVRSGRIDPL